MCKFIGVSIFYFLRNKGVIFLRYSTHSFTSILESIFYDATTISRVAVLYSGNSNERCYGKPIHLDWLRITE